MIGGAARCGSRGLGGGGSGAGGERALGGGKALARRRLWGALAVRLLNRRGRGGGLARPRLRLTLGAWCAPRRAVGRRRRLRRRRCRGAEAAAAGRRRPGSRRRDVGSRAAPRVISRP